MKRRWIIAVILGGACVTMLILLFRVDDSAPGKTARTGAAAFQEPDPAPSAESAAATDGARRLLEDGPPVDLDFVQRPLPDVIDELVRQTGIRVIADFSPAQDRTVVTMQMNAPPFMVLQTIADEHEMELLHTDAGWWLRPLDAVQHVCYRVHDLGGDADAPRVARLVENLRKLVGEKDGAAAADGPPISVTSDAEGIHIAASRDAQSLAAEFLESAFHRAVEARREDLPATP